MAYPISKLIFYPIFAILMRRIKGMENIPSDKAFIIISNHEKKIDSLLIAFPIIMRLNKKVHFLSNAAWWFLGETICRKWAGCIPIFDPKHAYGEMKEYLVNGKIVALFPEGNYKNQNKKNFKTGAVRLALETNTPILPIGIKSSYVPFASTIRIGKLIYLRKNKKSIENQTADLMKHIYRLRNDKD